MPLDVFLSDCITKPLLLERLRKLTTEPILNQSDVPAVPHWSEWEGKQLEEAAERIRLSWKLYRQNRGA